MLQMQMQELKLILQVGTGSAHTLSVAFDGVNKKFVATYDGGTKAQMTRAVSIVLIS